MGRPWAEDLPVIDVTCGREPHPVTLVLPYYINPRFLVRQMASWRRYSDELLKQFSVIVVDDGSPEYPAAPVVSSQDKLCPVSVFRIDVDVRWNWLAARNIGAFHANDGWLLLTDMDHLVPQATLEACVFGVLDEKRIYAFQRKEHTGQDIYPHSASFLMTRKMFWTVGGYDETLSGHYGTDGLFRKRLRATASMAVLREHLVRYEYVEDSSTTRYLRKQPEDAGVSTIAAKLPKSHMPKTLSFPYHEVSV